MMTPEQKKVGVTLSLLAHIYGEYWDEERLTAYLIPLEGLDPELIVQACGILAKTSRWMPRPADIINLCQCGGLSPDDLAEAAYVDLVRMKDPEESARRRRLDPAFSLALDSIGGWHGWAQADARYARRDFLAAYKAALARERAERHGVLPPCLDRGLRLTGAESEPPGLPSGPVGDLVQATAEKMGGAS